LIISGRPDLVVAGVAKRGSGMRRLSVFNNVSVDGYFCDAQGDMSWAHKQDAEWEAFTSANASGGGVLLFGRITYELMASFWPTPEALEAWPVVAERMNSLPKVVFSNSLAQPSWQNTDLVSGDIESFVENMKREPGPDIVIMGSGTIVAQLTDARLIDAYQIVVTPIVLGSGRTMFEGVKEKVPLRLTGTRAFDNGNVVLWYAPPER
jgi:dihydrofolate reductase